jgi:hypothetical protein
LQRPILFVFNFDVASQHLALRSAGFSGLRSRHLSFEAAFYVHSWRAGVCRIVRTFVPWVEDQSGDAATVMVVRAPQCAIGEHRRLLEKKEAPP